jgi:aromatic-L-amino-acid decarboxylase
MEAAEFRQLGHALIDQVADFIDTLPQRPITKGPARKDIRALIGDGGLPRQGEPAGPLLKDTASKLFDYSLHNGNPLFLGYITSSAAPLGALADMLAASLNANMARWDLSPLASEIETQTIGWLSEFVGYPNDAGGIMVSGGNMANMLGFFAARTAQADWDIRQQGLYPESRRLTLYASRETHTWVEKAADISGLGTDAIRWVETNAEQQIRLDSLENQLRADIKSGCRPFMVIGTAGNVSTGAIDPLSGLADIASEHELWFHIDGAYGAPAAILPEAPEQLRALARADSIAMDPHKWLYCPIEVACTLVRNPQHLRDAFSFHPPYYVFDDSDQEPGTNFYELGLQNSRGFRALKVWLALRHIGRDGYVEMIRNDIGLAKVLYDGAAAHPELEARTQNLSITTLRFVPAELGRIDGDVEDYLNTLNSALLLRLQKGGQAFVSNAVIDTQFFLRACVVNFRTTPADMDRLIEIIVNLGRELHREISGS